MGWDGIGFTVGMVSPMMINYVGWQLKSSSSSEDHEQGLVGWIMKRLLSVRTINDKKYGEKQIFTASRLPSGENATASNASPRLWGRKLLYTSTSFISSFIWYDISWYIYYGLCLISTCRELKGFQNLPEVYALCFQGCQGEVLHPWCQPILRSLRSNIMIDDWYDP